MFKALTPFLSIITAILVVVSFVRPMYAEIQEIQAETAQYEEALAQASASNAKLQDLLQKKNSLSVGELERIDAIAPSEINVVKTIVDLDALARKHNMLFRNTPTAGAGLGGGAGAGSSGLISEAGFGSISEEDFEYSDVSFMLIGTYADFKKFLADLERSLSIMEITKISFMRADSMLDAGDLMQVELAIRTYALRNVTFR